jgi:hypothetical protein
VGQVAGCEVAQVGSDGEAHPEGGGSEGRSGGGFAGLG